MKPGIQQYKMKQIIFSENMDVLREVLAVVCAGNGADVIVRWNEFSMEQKHKFGVYAQSVMGIKHNEIGKTKGWEERKKFEKRK